MRNKHSKTLVVISSIFLAAATLAAQQAPKEALSLSKNRPPNVGLSSGDLPVKNATALVYSLFLATGPTWSENVFSVATITVSGLDPNRAYYASLALADGKEIPGEASSFVKAVTLAEPPEPYLAGIFQSSATIAWMPLSGSASGFLAQASTDPNFSQFISSKTKNDGQESLAVSRLKPATTYYFRLAGLNEEGKPSYSSVISGLTLAPPFVLAPRPTSTRIVASGDDALTLAWTQKSSGMVTYTVALSSSADSFEQNIIHAQIWTNENSVPGEAATATITGLNPNTLYYGAVRAALPDFLPSSYSAPAPGVTLTVAPQPNIAAVYSSSATIAWSLEKGEASEFRVEVSTEPSFSGSVSTATKNSGLRALTVRHLQPQTTYYCRVAGVNQKKVSHYSPIAAFMTLSTAPIAAAPAQQEAGPITPAIKEPVLLSKGLAAMVWESSGSAHVELPELALPQDGFIVIESDPLKKSRMIDSQTLQIALNKVKLDPALTLQPLVLKELVYLDADSRPINQSLQKPAFISFSYQDKDKASNLVIWYLDAKERAFVSCPASRVNEAQQVVTCQWQHFTVYALMAVEEAPQACVAAYAYPVPWRPNDGNPQTGDQLGISFAGLPNSGKIEIYDINAELKRSLVLNGSQAMRWDGRADNGEVLASGVYLWRLTSQDAAKTGKLMIIR